jgi:hypothetical protein
VPRKCAFTPRAVLLNPLAHTESPSPTQAPLLNPPAPHIYFYSPFPLRFFMEHYIAFAGTGGKPREPGVGGQGGRGIYTCGGVSRTAVLFYPTEAVCYTQRVVDCGFGGPGAAPGDITHILVSSTFFFYYLFVLLQLHRLESCLRALPMQDSVRK